MSGVLSGLSGLSIALSDTEPATESNDGDCESDGGDDKSCKLQSTQEVHTKAGWYTFPLVSYA